MWLFMNKLWKVQYKAVPFSDFDIFVTNEFFEGGWYWTYQKSQRRAFIMDHFELVSEYKPTGDQPQAIEQLVKGFQEGNQCQTLLGVTGSGKTFTMANVIQQLNKPTLIIAHNKTLAAQLYGEFKEFFPNNAVEYFVSYYVLFQNI